MSKFIIGRKGRMTQMFTESGECVPVTLLEVGPCWVTALKKADEDGYNAVQIGYDPVRETLISKPERGHLAKAGVPALRTLREYRVDAAPTSELGSEIKADCFTVGEEIDVAGLSKGRGFSGAMRRYNFKGGPMTHGGMCRRFPGSIGMHTYPGRVFKGKRMSGHYGVERVKVKNLKVMAIDLEKNIVVVKGAVPGHRGALIELCSAVTPKHKVKA
ncbi:MAG: 50S ribosomal protein L3 [Planctomycetes bacterium]|nr:50S ribosomal protein L3 [Planctomycetota bacterium]